MFPDPDENEIKDKNKEVMNKQNPTNVTFFVRPALTFYLSNQSKTNFINNVPRKQSIDKYMELIKFSDYSLFEMVVNQHMIRNSKLAKFLSGVSYKLIEFINYLFIIVQNILLMYHFYK